MVILIEGHLKIINIASQGFFRYTYIHSFHERELQNLAVNGKTAFRMLITNIKETKHGMKVKIMKDDVTNK